MSNLKPKKKLATINKVNVADKTIFEIPKKPGRKSSFSEDIKTVKKFINIPEETDRLVKHSRIDLGCTQDQFYDRALIAYAKSIKNI